MRTFSIIIAAYNEGRTIAELLDPALRGEADVVHGNRFADGLPFPEYPMRSYRANRFLTCLINRFTGLNIGDMEVCYMLIHVPVTEQLIPREQSSGSGPEVTSRLARMKGLRVEISTFRSDPLP